MHGYANISSHFVGCLFTFLIVSFSAQKFLILKKPNLSTLPLVACAFGIISKKTLPNSRSQRFTPILSSKTFIALPFTFRSLICFELIFIFIFWPNHVASRILAAPDQGPNPGPLQWKCRVLITGPLGNFELIFICDVSYGSKYDLLHIDIQLVQHCLLKRLFFLH